MMDAGTWTIVGTIVATTITSITTLALGRRKATTDIQGVVNQGFEVLIKALKDEKIADGQRIAQLEEALEECRRERLNCREEIARLRALLPDYESDDGS